MAKTYMYRGTSPIRVGDIVVMPRELLDEDHPAVVNGWDKVFPVKGDAPAPKKVDEAVRMTANETVYLGNEQEEDDRRRYGSLGDPEE